MIFLAQRFVRSTYDFLWRSTRYLQVVIVSMYLSHLSIILQTVAAVATQQLPGQLNAMANHQHFE